MVDTAASEQVGAMTKRVSQIAENCTIRELVDVEPLHKILGEFYLATGFNVGIITYPDQKLLVGTSWRALCTRFHLACPESAKFCSESHGQFTSELNERGECSIRTCRNGLVDGAAPVIVRGRHLATVFSGQILLEEPDVERFKEQGQFYGYDLDDYLEELSKVPVVTESKFRRALSFLSQFTSTIAELGLESLEAAMQSKAKEREFVERQNGEMVRQEAERRYREICEVSRDGYIRCSPDGRFVEGNASFLKMVGYTIEELKERTCWDITPEMWHHREKSEIFEKGSQAPYRKEFIKKDGSLLPVELRISLIRDKTNASLGWWGVVRDLTNRLERSEELARAREEAALVRRDLEKVKGERESMHWEMEKARKECRTLQNVLAETQADFETNQVELESARKEIETIRKELGRSRETAGAREGKPSSGTGSPSDEGRSKGGGKIREEEIFDRSGMLERLGGDETLIEETVTLFLKKIPNQIRSLKDAQAEHDAAMICCQARAIEESAAHAGALRIQAKASFLRTLGEERKIGRIPSHVKKLERELRRLKKILPSWKS